MKHLTCILGIAVCLSIMLIQSAAYSQLQKPYSTVAYLDNLRLAGKERVIITFNGTVDPALVAKYGGKLIRKLAIINALIAEIPAQNVTLLRQEKAVKEVVPDIIIKAEGEYERPVFIKTRIIAEPYDSVYLKTAVTSATDGTAITYAYTGPVTVRWNNLEAGLNSKAAWDRYNLSGAGIRIAILDTGINYTMENLDTNYLGGYDFVTPDANPINDTPDETHGTIVASVAVGEGINKVVGVAYGASYYSVRVLDSTASGLLSNIMAGIEWCLDPDGSPVTTNDRPDIISMSFGIYDDPGNPFWPGIKQDFENVCNAAYDAGIILVAASGNSGYTYSAYPAAFANVISVGGHAEDQTRYDYNGHSSNGGVDIVAPGAMVYSVHPDNSSWWVWGTSLASPQAAGLIALQLQYARQTNDELDYQMKPNNGYLWEVMKHSAKDMPLIPDDYKGKGKIWAADTIPPPEPPPPPLPWMPKDGSIDAMVAKWPLGYDFTYSNYAYIDSNGYPAYYIGTNMYQDITLSNNTVATGNYPADIENINVTTTQAYYQSHNEAAMPGDSTQVFATQQLISYAESSALLEDTYYIPWGTYPGLDRTILDLQFELADDINNRLIKVTYPYSSIWCPPPSINQGFPILDQAPVVKNEQPLAVDAPESDYVN